MWEPKHDAEVERIFHLSAATRLSDMLYDERMHYSEDHSYRPGWIGEDDWRVLLSYWATNNMFKNRSVANKRNRKSARACLHTQGSVSSLTHARQLVKIYGFCIFFYILFFCIYIKVI